MPSASRFAPTPPPTLQNPRYATTSKIYQVILVFSHCAKQMLKQHLLYTALADAEEINEIMTSLSEKL